MKNPAKSYSRSRAIMEGYHLQRSTSNNGCRYHPTTKLRLVEDDSSSSSPALPFLGSNGTLVPASQLEQWLTRRLAVECPANQDDDKKSDEDEEDVVLFAIRADAHWLKCQPLRAYPLLSILGIYEDEGNPHLPVQTSYLRAAVDLNGTVNGTCGDDNDNDEGSSANSAGTFAFDDSRPLHSEWKRQPRQRLDKSTSPTSSGEASSSSSSPYHLQWIDFRSMIQQQDNDKESAQLLSLDFLSTPQDVWHFLTSLLGNHHGQNPWMTEPTTANDDSNTTSSTPEMVALLLPRSYPALRDFRVSDACPAWFFHGYAYLEHLEGNDGPAVLYMYKRLKPRVRLSRTHPLSCNNHETTIAPPPGCLWETVPAPIKDNAEGDEGGGDDTKQDQQLENVAAEEPTYRFVAPPYLDLEQEYGREIANGLFSPEALEIFRREAVQIPQWTPWPETQHYSVGPNGETTWSVFPLCYCFPSRDVSKRTWVEQTCHFCPQTCQILQSVLGNTLRTALFSQLRPETVLEAHTGWADLANDVYRLHIPLVVPPGYLCGTWVDGCVETHEAGRPILFDDSKIHRAFNYHPTQSRIVLIVDLARPSTLPPGTATGGHSDELDQFIAQMSVPK